GAGASALGGDRVTGRDVGVAGPLDARESGVGGEVDDAVDLEPAEGHGAEPGTDHGASRCRYGERSRLRTLRAGPSIGPHPGRQAVAHRVARNDGAERT